MWDAKKAAAAQSQTNEWYPKDRISAVLAAELRRQEDSAWLLQALHDLEERQANAGDASTELEPVVDRHRGRR